MNPIFHVAGHASGRLVKNRVLKSSALIALLAAASAAQAQEASDLASQNSTDIVVTAQRMEERLIDVPISVSAFTMEQLAEQKIETGAELLRAIPNVNFSKDNFTGYNFSIRGIGTKVTSTSADPAVAISFNNTTLLRNRLFEQEYFDIERLEVLRGPQGTLYGRNATAGVVNMIPAKPKLGRFDGEIQGEVGNFSSTRLRGMINVPLGENFAIRGAGAWTKREGFDYNTVTGKQVNGRDLWSTRLSARWEPSDRLRVTAYWEHFNEDDNRSRTGKQLCTRGETPGTFEYVGDDPKDRVDPKGIKPRTAFLYSSWFAGTLSPGCKNESLFTDDAYGVPNGLGFPVVTGLAIIQAGFGGDFGNLYTKPGADPFGTENGRQASNSLREISTNYDPVFRAKNDIFQFNVEFDASEDLHFTSQTLYMKDSYFGSQDFFRFASKPGFARREKFISILDTPTVSWDPYMGASNAAGNGVFCDPQLGCLDHAAAVDVSRSKSKQWSQELRLQSSFDGPVNFSAGANFVKFKTEEDYIVYSNLLTAIALGVNQISQCGKPDVTGFTPGCIYIDPNPIGEGPEDGHNYLRSLSIAKIRSAAAFGEVYWKASEQLKFTLGLRFTEDKKTLTPVPTQLLGARSKWGGSNVDRGYPREENQTQKWGRFTGRFAVDWKPEVSFTDDTLVYASYSRGYKAGGGNPAGNAVSEFATYTQLPEAYAPEYVNAFEIGTKNQLAGGKFMFRAAAFYNDYKGYQISQLINRGFHTENFDARTMGAELEAAWIPSRNFRIGGTFGYLNTRLGKGQSSIDVMDRTQGNDDWVTIRPWAQSPNTCIAPRHIVGQVLSRSSNATNPRSTPPGWKPSDGPVNNSGSFALGLLCEAPDVFGGAFKPGGMGNMLYGITYDPVTDAPNQGRGFAAPVGGNQLPNAPEFTFNIGAQYTFFFEDWQLALRGDYYRQSSSYARIYNTAYDKLKGWGNGNVALTLTRPESDLSFQFYVKNILNSTPITDAFTGPDELGNFTNVFTLDPRIYGLNVKVGF